MCFFAHHSLNIRDLFFFFFSLFIFYIKSMDKHPIRCDFPNLKIISHFFSFDYFYSYTNTLF